MAEGEFDDIEMQNRNLMEEEEEEEEYKEAETDLGGKDPNESIQIFNTENPRFQRTEWEIPDVKKDAKGMKKSITEDRKKSFRKIFNVDIKKENGKNSSELIDNTNFIRIDNGKLAILYKDKKIGEFNEKEKRIDYFKKKNKIKLQEFQNIFEEAKKEYEKTLDSVVDEEMEKQGFEDWDDYDWDPYGVEREFLKDSVVSSSIDSLNSSIENIQENMKEEESNISEQDIRELNGVLNPKGETAEEKMNFLKYKQTIGDKKLY